VLFSLAEDESPPAHTKLPSRRRRRQPAVKTMAT
jgi:hypothetical protein